MAEVSSGVTLLSRVERACCSEDCCGSTEGEGLKGISSSCEIERTPNPRQSRSVFNSLSLSEGAFNNDLFDLVRSQRL